MQFGKLPVLCLCSKEEKKKNRKKMKGNKGLEDSVH